MYDSIEQMIYIITKKYYQPCKVYRLPFRLDYGNEVQKLEYVCDLGIQSDLGEGPNPSQGFHLVTAADISPNGKYILIKNHNNISAVFSWTLIWERDGNESITETLKRQPEVIGCYQYESQGEAICWLDNHVFYTTSDADGWNPPIYLYYQSYPEGIENVADQKKTKELVLEGNILYIRTQEGLFTLDGRRAR